MSRGLGWKPELPDIRDRKFALSFAPRAGLLALPLNVDLRKDARMPPVVDQGSTSSCVGNAIAGMLDFLHPDPAYASGVFMPSSRRFIYWGACDLEGTAGQDGGCYIRDGMKIAAQGVPHELACRFSEQKITTRPAKVAFTQAERRRKIATYHRLDTVPQMQACLAEGFPFVGGFTVYSAFLSDAVARTGQLDLPNTDRESVEGGHAVCFVGYDVSAQRFIVRNSWGPDWGTGGFFTMPFAYVASRDLSDDFWTARL